MKRQATDIGLRMPPVILAAAWYLTAASAPLAGQTATSFRTEDGGVIHADEYGAGNFGVVLAPGGRFERGSWREQALELEQAGYRVLAIDFRGRGQSRGPTADVRDEDFRYDVLAGVRYLRSSGSETVVVIGASYGGWAAANAAVVARPDEINALILIAASSIEDPERIATPTMFIAAQGDTTASGSLRLDSIRDQYRRANGRKELVVLDGDAHAQFIFDTPQGGQLMNEILRFLASADESRTRAR